MCIKKTITVRGSSSKSMMSLDELLTLSCPALMKSLLEVTETFTDKEPGRENRKASEVGVGL
jgi:hypothetical protein